MCPLHPAHPLGDARELRDAVDAVLEQMIAQQEHKLRAAGRRLVPDITLDDLLAPDDVPALRRDPEFLYESGLLAGLLSCRAALRALFAASSPPPDRG